VPPLPLQGNDPVECRVGGKAAGPQASLQQRQGQIPAQLPLVALGGQPVLLEHPPIAIGRKRAIDLEDLLASHGVGHILVTHPQTICPDIAKQHLPVDQLLQGLAAELIIVKERRIELITQHPPQLGLPLLEGLIELRPADLLAVYLGHGLRPSATADITVEAGDHKGHHQQDQHRDGQSDSHAITYRLEHDWFSVKSKRRQLAPS
jgi:hypothetical protein